MWCKRIKKGLFKTDGVRRKIDGVVEDSIHYQSIGRLTIMAEIKFEIIKNIGILSESSKGWTKELNLISWNGREPKYDIRDWDPEHQKMGKGVTLTEEELKKLKELLGEMAN